MVDSTDSIGDLGGNVDGPATVATAPKDPKNTTAEVQAQAEIAQAEELVRKLDAMIANLPAGAESADERRNLETMRGGIASSVASARGALANGHVSLANAIIGTSGISTIYQAAQGEEAHAKTDEAEADQEESLEAMEYAADSHYTYDPFNYTQQSNTYWEYKAEQHYEDLRTIKTNEIDEYFRDLGMTTQDVTIVKEQSLSHSGDVLASDVQESAGKRLSDMTTTAYDNLKPEERELLKAREQEMQTYRERAEKRGEEDIVGKYAGAAYKGTFDDYAKENPKLAEYVKKAEAPFLGAPDLHAEAPKLDEVKALEEKRTGIMAKVESGEKLTPEEEKSLNRLIVHDVDKRMVAKAKDMNTQVVKAYQESAERELAAIQQEMKKPEGERDIQGVLEKAKKARDEHVHGVKSKLGIASETPEAAHTDTPAPKAEPTPTAQTDAPAPKAEPAATAKAETPAPSEPEQKGVTTASATPPASAVDNPYGTLLAGFKPADGIKPAPEKTELAGVGDNPKNITLPGVKGGDDMKRGETVAAVNNAAMKRPEPAVGMSAMA